MAIEKKHEDAVRVLSDHLLQATEQTENVEQLLCVAKDNVDTLRTLLHNGNSNALHTPILEEALQRAIEKRHDAMHVFADHLRATGQTTNATENPPPPSKPRHNKKDKDTLGCICS